MDFTKYILKELTDTPGVPGYMTPIRSVVRGYLEKYGELTQDNIGSVICCSQTTDCFGYTFEFENGCKFN